MFGLFKKKKEEPKQKPVEVSKEVQSQEYKAFAADFPGEETDILAVTSPSVAFHDPIGETGLYKYSLSLTAWMDEYTHELQQGEATLEAVVDMKLLAYLLSHVPRNFIITATVRPSEDGMRFMMTDLPQPGFDPDLKVIMDKQKEPVTLEVNGLGTFTLSRTQGWFECSVDWLDEEISLTFDQEEDTREGAQDTARALMGAQEDWDRRVRAFAADTLLEQANALLEEDEDAEPLTHEDFQEQLILDSVYTTVDGAFEFRFSGDDLFLAHPVHVTGTVADGPTVAVMDGEP